MGRVALLALLLAATALLGHAKEAMSETMESKALACASGSGECDMVPSHGVETAFKSKAKIFERKRKRAMIGSGGAGVQDHLLSELRAKTVQAAQLLHQVSSGGVVPATHIHLHAGGGGGGRGRRRRHRTRGRARRVREIKKKMRGRIRRMRKQFKRKEKERRRKYSRKRRALRRERRKHRQRHRRWLRWHRRWLRRQRGRRGGGGGGGGGGRRRGPASRRKRRTRVRRERARRRRSHKGRDKRRRHKERQRKRSIRNRRKRRERRQKRTKRRRRAEKKRKERKRKSGQKSSQEAEEKQEAKQQALEGKQKRLRNKRRRERRRKAAQRAKRQQKRRREKARKAAERQRKRGKTREQRLKLARRKEKLSKAARRLREKQKKATARLKEKARKERRRKHHPERRRKRPHPERRRKRPHPERRRKRPHPERRRKRPHPERRAKIHPIHRPGERRRKERRRKHHPERRAKIHPGHGERRRKERARKHHHPERRAKIHPGHGERRRKERARKHLPERRRKERARKHHPERRIKIHPVHVHGERRRKERRRKHHPERRIKIHPVHVHGERRRKERARKHHHPERRIKIHHPHHRPGRRERKAKKERAIKQERRNKHHVTEKSVKVERMRKVERSRKSPEKQRKESRGKRERALKLAAARRRELRHKERARKVERKGKSPEASAKERRRKAERHGKGSEKVAKAAAQGAARRERRLKLEAAFKRDKVRQETNTKHEHAGKDEVYRKAVARQRLDMQRERARKARRQREYRQKGEHKQKAVERLIKQSTGRRRQCYAWVNELFHTHLARYPNPAGAALRGLVSACVHGCGLRCLRAKVLASPEYQCRLKVQKAYQTVLHRAPGVPAYNKYLPRCVRGQCGFRCMVAALQHSRESMCHKWVPELFRELLGRAPEPAAVLWFAKVQCLHKKCGRECLANMIRSSPEYRLRMRFPKCNLVVRNTFSEVLHRTPTNSEFQRHLTNCIHKGCEVDCLRKKLYASADYGKRCQVWVHRLYGLLFHRTPRPTGLAKWVNVCRTPCNYVCLKNRMLAARAQANEQTRGPKCTKWVNQAFQAVLLRQPYSPEFWFHRSICIHKSCGRLCIEEKLMKTPEYIRRVRETKPWKKIATLYRPKNNWKLHNGEGVGQGYTFAMWVNPRGLQPFRGGLLERGARPDEERSPGIYLNPASTKLTVISSSTTNPKEKLQPPQSLPLKQWSHVAVSHCMDGKLRVYINGHIVEEKRNTIPASPFPAPGSCRKSRVATASLSGRFWGWTEWPTGRARSGWGAPAKHMLYINPVTGVIRVALYGGIGDYVVHVHNRHQQLLVDYPIAVCGPSCVAFRLTRRASAAGWTAQRISPNVVDVKPPGSLYRRTTVDCPPVVQSCRGNTIRSASLEGLFYNWAEWPSRRIRSANPMVHSRHALEILPTGVIRLVLGGGGGTYNVRVHDKNNRNAAGPGFIVARCKHDTTEFTLTRRARDEGWKANRITTNEVQLHPPHKYFYMRKGCADYQPVIWGVSASAKPARAAVFDLRVLPGCTTSGRIQRLYVNSRNRLPADNQIHSDFEGTMHLTCSQFWTHKSGGCPKTTHAPLPQSHSLHCNPLRSECIPKCCKPTVTTCGQFHQDAGCLAGFKKKDNFGQQCKDDPSAGGFSCNNQCCQFVPLYQGKCGYWGDPHANTFDNNHFDCQTPGEYILYNDPARDEAVHSFEEKWDGNEAANIPSLNVGVGIRDGKSTLTYFEEPKQWEHLLVTIRFNGQIIPFPDRRIRYGNFVLTPSGDVMPPPMAAWHPSFGRLTLSIVNLRTHTGVLLRHNKAGNMRYMDLEVTQGGRNRLGSKTGGICGSWDRNAANDLSDRNGRNCNHGDANSCCLSWMVRPHESIFYPAEPELDVSGLCTMATSCPAGWNDHGVVGTIMQFANQDKYFPHGGPFNPWWRWTHPRICCARQKSSRLDGLVVLEKSPCGPGTKDHGFGGLLLNNNRYRDNPFSPGGGHDWYRTWAHPSICQVTSHETVATSTREFCMLGHRGCKRGWFNHGPAHMIALQASAGVLNMGAFYTGAWKWASSDLCCTTGGGEMFSRGWGVYVKHKHTDIGGHDVGSSHGTALHCAKACMADSRCVAFTRPHLDDHTAAPCHFKGTEHINVRYTPVYDVYQVAKATSPEKACHSAQRYAQARQQCSRGLTGDLYKNCLIEFCAGNKVKDVMTNVNAVLHGK